LKNFYTCEEIATLFSLNIVTIWRWIRSGKLKAVKVGKAYRIPSSSLEPFKEIFGND
jgi:excisionase family DNA binding protein